MECYACDSQATRQCRRCARVYCEVHGGDLCAECLNPASALPSFNLYRGSLLALLVGTAIALWLLVQPPGTGDSRTVVLGITTTPVVTAEVNTPTPASASGTPAATTETPGPTETPGSTPTPTVTTYTVRSGDTLTSIAQQFAPAGVAPVDYVREIAAANGISVQDTIRAGQPLVLP